MVHSEKIKAIHARVDLTQEEKRSHSYAIRDKAFRGLAQVVHAPWTDGDVATNVGQRAASGYKQL